MPEIGKPIEREMKGGETHTYQIPLQAGQFLNLEVTQNGVDVVVLLLSPDGKKLEVDSPNGNYGPEPIWFVTEAAGNYRLEIKTLEKTVPNGKYSIKINELRASSPKDKIYVTAQKTLSEAELFWAKDTEESSSKAVKSLEEATRLIQLLDDANQLARINDRIGRIYLSQSILENALKHFFESLKFSEQSGNKDLQARALHKIADVYNDQANYQLAIDYYQKSLNLDELVGFKPGIAANANDLGGVYLKLDEFDKALPLFEKTQKIGEETGSNITLAAALNNIGLVYWSQGNSGKALEYQIKQLALGEEMRNKAIKARALHSLANAHPNGDIRLQYLQKALILAEEIKDKRHISMILSDIGVSYSWNDNQKALEYYQKSLALDESLGLIGELPVTLTNIGAIYNEQGDFERALQVLEKSLAISKQNRTPSAECSTLLEMARVYFNQKNYQKALETAQKAEAIIKDKDIPYYLWNSQNLQGEILLWLKEPAKARQAFQDSIAVIEKYLVRKPIGLPEQSKLRREMVASYYELLKLQVQENKLEEAFALAERTKAGILLNILQSGKVGIKKAITAQEQEQEKRLKNELVSLNTQISRETGQEKPDKTRLSDLRTQLEKQRLEFEDFQTRLYATHPELKIQRGEMKPVSLVETSELISDNQTALLEFVVAEDKTFLFVLNKVANQSSVSLKVYPIDIKQKDLAQRVENFRSKLAKADLDFQPLARDLFDLLLKPAAAQLQGKNNLIIVPDADLWNLPFQALQSTQNRYLIETAALSYAPSLTALKEMTRIRKSKANRSASTELLAFGNPIVGKETKQRVNQVFMSERLEPIPEAERLVNNLEKLYGANKSKVFTGAEASEERAKTESSKYRILQFATHGILNDASPMYSHLVLSEKTTADANEDGLLEAWEMKDLNLNADMVILSACETARGRVSAGEGVIGMSWSLFIAGAPTTVVSQWKVESASTTELMLEFHRQLLTGKNISKSEALRRASLKLLKTPQYKHPSYWAPFVIVGDGF